MTFHSIQGLVLPVLTLFEHAAGKATRAEGNTEVEAAKVLFASAVSHVLAASRCCTAVLISCHNLQAKGYAEGAGDSLAGGLKKNVAKVTGNDQKEAEGTPPICVC